MSEMSIQVVPAKPIPAEAEITVKLNADEALMFYELLNYRLWSSAEKDLLKKVFPNLDSEQAKKRVRTLESNWFHKLYHSDTFTQTFKVGAHRP